jgi:dipeptidyl aminopeptidase/acylaminoacyl peptidase
VPRHLHICRAITISVIFALFSVFARAPASVESVYRKPDQVIVDIVDAPRTPHVRLDPTLEWMILAQRPTYPSIAELAEPELRLGGMRFRPQTHAPSRTWPYFDLRLVRISDLHEREIVGLAERPRMENVRWSPDGTRVAFTNTVDDGVELWVVEVASGEASRLTGPILSLTAEAPPEWLVDGSALIACVLDPARGPEPEAPRAPAGPVIQESIGREAPARTYQDLLEGPHDEDLFEYHLTSQLAKVELDGTMTQLGAPGIIWSFDPSPDGKYILVNTLHRPFSYVVNASRFPRRVEVWDERGNVVREIADLPLQEEIPIAYGSVATGPRRVSWRDDAEAALSWTEALDGGDAGAEADVRDRLYTLAAPFDGEPVPLATLELRFGGVYWGSGDLALVSEYWWETRRTRTWILRPRAPETPPELLFDRSWEDRYNAPGDPVTRRNAAGRYVLVTKDNDTVIFLAGEGASPEGDRPFFDELDLTTGETTRLMRSEAPYYEQPLLPLDDDGRLLLTRRESPEEVPNYYVRDLNAGTLRQITFFPHPTPQLLGLQKELIRYKRDDGVDLTATLYLPADYDVEDGPLPMIVWAYPREFRSADAAGQVQDSPYRFDWVGWWSPLLWLTQGYAALEGPTMPIIGEGDEEPNDTYIEQLVSSAEAAVDKVVRRGVAEPGRIAVGGHSYGAFMAANLLAHSDIFAAGLARTGAYNRTLTPFGFQSEDRTLWEARDVYVEMSPFMHADKINEPILLVHGEADNNPGTFPMQSERLYNALKGLGATVRLVMLPHESHSYRARESILHLLWETQEWLDSYVKNAGVTTE